MSETTPQAENLKLPTGKLGQPTTDTAILRAADAVTASKAFAENGPQITRPAEAVTAPAAPGKAVAPAANEAAAAAATGLQAALPLLDLFRTTTRLSVENMQTLCDNWISLGRGVRDMQVQWLTTIGSSAGVKPELWQAQRDQYVHGLDRMFETTSRMLALATKSVTKETTH